MCASPASDFLRRRVPLPIPGRRHRVGREHPIAGGDQRRRPRTPLRLDFHPICGTDSPGPDGSCRYPAIRACNLVIPSSPSENRRRARLRPSLVDDLDIVVALYSVITHEQHARLLVVDPAVTAPRRDDPAISWPKCSPVSRARQPSSGHRSSQPAGAPSAARPTARGQKSDRVLTRQPRTESPKGSRRKPRRLSRTHETSACLGGLSR
jgi:hypothetical protein